MIASADKAALARPDNNQSPSQILDGAREFYPANRSNVKFPYNEPTFGYVVKWHSELGKATELAGLLAYADEYLHPTWENGGLYYPRNDEATDAQGRWTHMEKFTGNAAIGYSRLNVKDGQKKMYDELWTSKTLSRRPYVSGLNLSQGVDCLRGFWNDSQNALIVTVREWAGQSASVTFEVMNIEAGSWSVFISGKSSTGHQVLAGKTISVTAGVDANEEVDFVIIQTP